MDGEHPRAHITNQRTVEIMRDMGIEDQLKAQATAPPPLPGAVLAGAVAAAGLVVAAASLAPARRAAAVSPTTALQAV